LRGAADWEDAERADELLVISSASCSLGCDHTEVSQASEPSQIFLGGCEGVAQRKHVRADYYLKLEFRKEQCAPQSLVPKTLVGKTVAKSTEQRASVQVPPRGRCSGGSNHERVEICDCVISKEPVDIERSMLHILGSSEGKRALVLS
jgi:hypothetical protein